MVDAASRARGTFTTARRCSNLGSSGATTNCSPLTRAHGEVVRGPRPESSSPPKLAERKTSGTSRMGDSALRAGAQRQRGQRGLAAICNTLSGSHLRSSRRADRRFRDKGVLTPMKRRNSPRAGFMRARAAIAYLTKPPEDRLTFESDRNRPRMGYTEHRGTRGVEAS